VWNFVAVLSSFARVLKRAVAVRAAEASHREVVADDTAKGRA